MYKCIYCNSEDLSVSDVISCALTGAKVTRKFVCKYHNKFTNQYESIAIKKLNFFRNKIGLTERDGSVIKYTTDLIINGVNINKTSLSDRASLYEDKKRLFRGSHNDKKVLVGNLNKLKQKNGIQEKDIEILDMHDVVESVTFSIQDLFASEEMLRTIAKTAYEWHCYINDIDFYDNKYQNIVDCVLCKCPVEEFVEICIDLNLETALSKMCDLGSHGLFEYTDTDGYKYVIVFFWGIICYKIRICDEPLTNQGVANELELFTYSIDGEKNKICFGILGKLHIHSASAVEVIKANHQIFSDRLQKLISTKILTFKAVEKMVDKLKESFVKYKNNSIEFASFLDYEDPDRINIIHLLFLLYENRNAYSFEKSFNENLFSMHDSEDVVIFSYDDRKDYVNYLMRLHEDSQLIDCIESSLKFFDQIVINEKQVHG